MLFNYFNGSNERIIGGEAEMRGFMIKCGERRLEGWKYMNDTVIETVECMCVDIWCMLD